MTKTTSHDVIIIGAGPAGIQAAIHAARKKVTVLMLGRVENSSLFNAHVENYACVEGVKTGEELLTAGLNQARGFGVEIRAEDVLKIKAGEEGFVLELESGTEVSAHALLFAMGTARKKLRVKGEKDLLGRGVSYCVDCDANFYRRAVVAVVGNHSAAVDGALTLLDYASKVFLVSKDLGVAPDLLARLKASAVEWLDGRWVDEILGQGAVTGLRLDNGDEVAVDGVFIELGSKGAMELATQVDVLLDTETFSHIAVNRKQETNVPGIYAAGDIAGTPYQMAKAVGEGCVAGMEAASYARGKKRQE